MILQPVRKEEITHTQLVKYAGASGDFNPIHTVVPIAQKAGFKDVIAHGMLIMGIAGEALGKWGLQKQLKQFKVRFQAMTFPGEKLIVEGKLNDPLIENGEVFKTGEIIIKNEQDEVKLKGSFRLSHM
ncbi:acyl dehydratase [Oikeobacillus pervagus]|uniref:Acyl dehydratase n=1 Tax=Oikeobacillus pervagus TaxID=1325931 RepID=A0AAJ1SZ24_9BACI|nr:MaoC/PaaZ C-terminal domain-containing protein [Oikeobacillus pervagus]MDQ0215479.1 acyl dehydratase [Oikeobacillus pervagus]